MTFMTIKNVVDQARGLLQDVDNGDSQVRWADPIIYTALNLGLLEARRLRPDFYRDAPDMIPRYTPPGDATSFIAFPIQYIPALIAYITGYVQIQDLEGTQDPRAISLLATFSSKLQSSGG